MKIRTDKLSKRSQFFAIFSCSATLAVRPFHVSAEEAFVLEEILVTAQKRVQSAQDVPISISALGVETWSKIWAFARQGMWPSWYRVWSQMAPLPPINAMQFVVSAPWLLILRVPNPVLVSISITCIAARIIWLEIISSMSNALRSSRGLRVHCSAATLPLEPSA